MPKYKFKREKLTTAEEVRAMIEKADSPWLKAAVAFLYLFGCRCTEMLKLRKEDIWVADGVLHARIPVLKRRQVNGPYGQPTHILRVKASAPFAEYIIKYVDSLPPGSRVFPHSRWWTWKKIKDLNPNISPHVFRHDRLTKIAMKRPDPYLLKEWAGWSDIRPSTYYVESVGYRTVQVQDLID